MNAPIVALEGYLGTNVPCFLFRSTFRSVTPGSPSRALRVRPQIDQITVESFDGATGVVQIATRTGLRARLQMHRSHLNAIQADFSEYDHASPRMETPTPEKALERRERPLGEGLLSQYRGAYAGVAILAVCLICARVFARRDR